MQPVGVAWRDVLTHSLERLLVLVLDDGVQEHHRPAVRKRCKPLLSVKIEPAGLILLCEIWAADVVYRNTPALLHVRVERRPDAAASCLVAEKLPVLVADSAAVQYRHVLTTEDLGTLQKLAFWVDLLEVIIQRVQFQPVVVADAGTPLVSKVRLPPPWHEQPL